MSLLCATGVAILVYIKTTKTDMTRRFSKWRKKKFAGHIMETSISCTNRQEVINKTSQQQYHCQMITFTITLYLCDKNIEVSRKNVLRNHLT